MQLQPGGPPRVYDCDMPSDAMPSDARPMVGFDPTQPCWIHERLNQRIFAWQPMTLAAWRKHATVGRHGLGVVNWDGLLFDGWWPWEERPSGALEHWPWSSRPPS